MKVSEIIKFLQAQLMVGEPDVLISGFASLTDAKPGDISFYADARYAEALDRTRASVILVPEGWGSFPVGSTCLAVANPSEAFSRLADKMGSAATEFQAEVHPSAVVGKDVVANFDRVRIGANAVIEEGASLGDGTDVGPGCFVGRNARIGANCRLHANVTVYASCVLGNRVVLHGGCVIGADGFGYEFENGKHRKVPQNGIVQIDDDVEVGANTTIDRARIGKTWIGAGTKIDNLVQIAHNVTVGKHCIIVAQCGIAGSATLGDYVVMAAQAGIGGHVEVGSQCTIGGRAGVTKSLPEGRKSYLGFPAVPVMQERRRIVASRQLPELLARVKQLEEEMRSMALGSEAVAA